MSPKILRKLLVIVVITGSFFSVPQSVDAEILVLPVTFRYDGLTFTEPLVYDMPTPLPTKTATLAFATVADIQAKHENATDKPALLLSPTTGLTPQPKTIITTSPTPTIYGTQAKQIRAFSTQEVTKTTAQLATPLPTTVPTAIPTVPPPPAIGETAGGMADALFSMANNYRSARGLPPFQKDDRTCSLAASRAPEVAGEVASGALHSGLQARNIPYWNTENIISMNSAEAAFNWWINDPIHHDAIVGNYTYSCVACSGGNCAQEFTNYQPK